MDFSNGSAFGFPVTDYAVNAKTWAELLYLNRYGLRKWD